MSEKQNTCCKERPENTLSVDDFPSSKEDSFPSLLLPECHTAGMRLLGGRDSVAMTPEALCPGRAPTLTGKSKQLPSCFTSSGQSIGLSGSVLVLPMYIQT